MISSPGLRREIDRLLGEQGFHSFGVAPAGRLGEDHDRLLEWIRSGRHGPLEYMRSRAPILLGPDHPDFLPGARSVIMVSLAFSRPEPPDGSLGTWVARHARGLDYHGVVGSRLRRVLDRCRQLVPGLRGRLFVDTAPVMEKAWAQRAGLGWIGLNGLLVQPGLGTFTVLGGVVIDADVEADDPVRDGCGDCRACVDACPARALEGDRLVDARRCLSCITVERRVPLREEDADLLEGRSAFGCDVCQEACPHNASPPPGDTDFDPLAFMREMTPLEFLRLDGSEADPLLEPTAIGRTGAARFAESLAAATRVRSGG